MSKSKTGRRLVRVKRNQHLHWPMGYGTGPEKYRGGEGTVVDRDAPFEGEWLEGQEYKIEDVPSGEELEVSPITNPLAIAKLAEYRKSQKTERATRTPAEQILQQQREAAEAEATAESPPAPDDEPPVEDAPAPKAAKGKKASSKKDPK